MRYPTLTKSATERLAARLIADDTDDVNTNNELIWTGLDPDVDLAGVTVMFGEMRAAFDDFERGEQAGQYEVFEGRCAGRLHQAFRELPIEVLDDPGFWRYVAIDHLWWFISKRESGPIAKGNVMTYVDGTHPTECVPLRMFLRAQAIRDGDDYSLASSMDRATDFWRSHILRVQTGSAPPLARGFARLQLEQQMPTDSQLRPFARRVNRLWANVVLHTSSETEANDLMAELYGSMQQEREVRSDGPDTP